MSLERIYSATESSWFLLDGDTTILTVKESLDMQEHLVTLTLLGNLRSDTEPIFQTTLEQFFSVGAHILLDFGGLQGISNACQLTLIHLQQKIDQYEKGSLTLCNVPEPIYKQFKQSHLSELLKIE